ncbi:lytic polysaccharide monooxygenase [Rhodococcus daqingensis]|uniref:Lytic polysaccharide monooxygenase n=1 Tax=Rhodococcus daqingensis TaxID=2479363 RepID=A0ABW2S2W8_9NOCA
MRRRIGFGAGLLASVVMFASGAPANAHGYIDSGTIVARQAATQNANRGPVQYEPQSLEAPKGFPAAGPADGKLASAGGLFGGNLDEQSPTRWYKNAVKAGPNRFTWKYTAPHNTSQWRYYLTKSGWDQNAPLRRSTFELIATVEHDGSAASTNPTHTVTIPADRKGYHVMYAVWDVADTANAFYNTIDLDVQGGGTAPTTTVPKPTTTVPTPTTTVPKPTTTVPTPGTDSQAPTAPGGVHSMSETDSSISLMWNASTDNVGVHHYDVLRAPAGSGNAFVKVGTTTKTTHKDTGLAASTAYRYKVVAFDAAGNSSSSEQFTKSTKAGPTQPTTAPTDPGPSSWNANAAYKKGDKVTHQGSVYTCVQSYQGNGDPNWINAPSLWSRL